MKTITEFNGFQLKAALATKREKLAALKAAGKSSAESAAELPAQMGEALKLEGEKLTLFLKAMSHVEKSGFDRDGGALKRIVVLLLGEGEKAPTGAVQPSVNKAVVSVKPIVTPVAAEASTDAPAADTTEALSAATSEGSPEAEPEAAAATESTEDSPEAATEAAPAQTAPPSAIVEEETSPHWFLAEYYPGVPKRGRPGGRDDRDDNRRGGRDGKGKKGGRGGDRDRGGPGRGAPGRGGERTAGSGRDGQPGSPPRDGAFPPRDGRPPRGPRGPGSDRPPGDSRFPRGPRPAHDVTKMPRDISVTVVSPGDAVKPNILVEGGPSRSRRPRRPEFKREPIRPGTGIPAVKPLATPITAKPVEAPKAPVPSSPDTQ